MYHDDWNDVKIARLGGYVRSKDRYRVYHGDTPVVALTGSPTWPAVLLDGETEYRRLTDLSPADFTVYQKNDEDW